MKTKTWQDLIEEVKQAHEAGQLTEDKMKEEIGFVFMLSQLFPGELTSVPQ